MKKLLFMISLALALGACGGTETPTIARPEIGMRPEKIQEIMGRPDKIRDVETANGRFEIWKYYDRRGEDSIDRVIIRDDEVVRIERE